MTTLYVIVGFSPFPFLEMSSSDYKWTDKKVRTYKALGQARAFRTVMRKKDDGFRYEIARIIFYDDGACAISWEE